MRIQEQRKTEKQGDVELTHKLILAYEPDNPAKAEKTLQLISATRHYLEKHFKPEDDSQKPLSYTQLRNIFLEVKKHDENLSRIIPTLAYMEAKLDDTNQRKLVKFIRELLEKAIPFKQKGEKIFIAYMELLVAFHKYYSSSKKK